MFLYRRSFINLAINTNRKSSLYLTSARFNSSSSCRDKEVKIAQTDDTTTVNNKKKETRISFMPVINIPETELAHNAFFSLHRPLLGLSDKHERSFFSNRQEQEESLDDQLANYMMSVQAFVPPLAPGEQQTQVLQEEEQVLDEEDTLVSIQFSTQQEEDYQTQSSLPVFHMPESNDILDYLTSVQSKLKANDQKLASEEQRLKKMEILNKNSGKTYNRRSVHNRLRRFQLKNWRK